MSVVAITMICGGSASWGCSREGVGSVGDGGREVGVGGDARSRVTGWRTVVDGVGGGCGVGLIVVVKIGVGRDMLVSQCFA